MRMARSSRSSGQTSRMIASTSAGPAVPAGAPLLAGARGRGGVGGRGVAAGAGAGPGRGPGPGSSQLRAEPASCPVRRSSPAAAVVVGGRARAPGAGGDAQLVAHVHRGVGGGVVGHQPLVDGGAGRRREAVPVVVGDDGVGAGALRLVGAGGRPSRATRRRARRRGDAAASTRDRRGGGGRRRRPWWPVRRAPGAIVAERRSERTAVGGSRRAGPGRRDTSRTAAADGTDAQQPRVDAGVRRRGRPLARARPSASTSARPVAVVETGPESSCSSRSSRCGRPRALDRGGVRRG